MREHSSHSHCSKIVYESSKVECQNTQNSPPACHQSPKTTPVVNTREMMEKLSQMELQLDQLVYMIAEREKKEGNTPDHIKELNSFQERERDIMQRQLIDQNNQMIKILEKKKQEIEDTARMRSNVRQMEIIKEQEVRIKEKEYLIKRERLQLQQAKKEDACKEAQRTKTQNQKIRKLKLNQEMEKIRQKIRIQHGLNDQDSLEDSCDSISLNLQIRRQHTPTVRIQQHFLPPEGLAIQLEEALVSRGPLNTLLIVEGDMGMGDSMEIVSPLSVNLSIKESRRYPFSQQSTIIDFRECY